MNTTPLKKDHEYLLTGANKNNLTKNLNYPKNPRVLFICRKTIVIKHALSELIKLVNQSYINNFVLASQEVLKRYCQYDL